jgi:Domain of Unknown Function with PDB structure (DUF3857)
VPEGPQIREGCLSSWRDDVSIPRCLALVVVCWLCLLVFPRQTEFADDWLPIDPAELKMTSEPQAPGAPAIFLYRQVDRRDLLRGAAEYNYVRIKILTEEGRDHANIIIPVQDKVHVSAIRARTIHPDGKILNFDGKVYEKVMEKTKGVKFNAKFFTVPDVQIGSIVEYRFTYDFDDYYIFNSHWTVSDDLFTKKAVFSLKPFPEWQVRWSWPAGLPPGTEVPKMGPDGLVHMTSLNVPAFQEEDYMPPANELKFRVQFVYSEETVEEDPVKYWKKFGKKMDDNMEGFLGKRKDLEGALATIVSAGDSPEVKLKKIYVRVESIRNLSFEPAKTEQEEKRDKQKTNDAAAVLKNNAGYGSQITWTFLALARAAGLDGHGGLVSRRDEYFFDEKRMNARELDSNIAIVRLNGQDMYFDPGAKFVPYGLLPWEETGVKGLRLEKDGGSWFITPFPPSKDSLIERTAKLKMTETGELEGTVQLKFTGLEGWTRRVEERNQDDPARKKFLEDELKADIPAAVDVELANKPDWSGTEEPLVAEFTLKMEGWASAAGRRALFPVGLFAAPEKHMFEHANRVNPICFEYSYSKKDDVTVQLPLGWKVASVPAKQDKDAKAAQYTLTVEENKGEVHIERKLRSDLYMLGKESYPSLRIFFQAVRSLDEQQIVLQPGAAAAAN